MSSGDPFILGLKGQRSRWHGTKDASVLVFRSNTILTFAAAFSLRHVHTTDIAECWPLFFVHWESVLCENLRRITVTLRYPPWRYVTLNITYISLFTHQKTIPLFSYTTQNKPFSTAECTSVILFIHVTMKVCLKIWIFTGDNANKCYS